MTTDSNNQSTPLTWLENGTPVSTYFDDSYFSRLDGRAETCEVFIQGNALPDRWKNAKHFTIAELGFGTGLNFLETLYQWNSFLEIGQKLSFISFEMYPVGQDDIRKTIQRWPELIPLAEDLCAQWPPQDGETLLDFGTVKLHLFKGDARTLIHQWSGMANAWYLDGFNPANNPELWDIDLLKAVYDHTEFSGTFSTYTAAGWVKRNLIAAGFDVKKVPGFKYKRERLTGVKR